MEYRLLGTLQAFDDGTELDLGAPMQRTLLAVLLLHPNELVSTDRLVDALWADEQPKNARQALQFHISRLRRALASGPSHAAPLVTETSGYRLAVAEGDVDTVRFEELVAAAERSIDDDPESAQGMFEVALELWREPPLSEFAYRDFAQSDIRRLNETRVQALIGRARAAVDRGRHLTVIGELDGLATSYPLNEEIRRLLMLALYRSGRQSEALREYAEVRRLLGEELGIEPGNAISDLEQKILMGDRDLDGPPAPQQTASHLPVVLSSFVGRDREVEDLVRSIDAHRLTTLTGLGGSGKTRLAVEVGHRSAERFRDGVHMVRLDAVDTDAGVAPMTAATLGARPTDDGSALSSIAAWGRDREALVVLDNCEHVIDGVLPVVQVLVDESPGVTILATSREPLRFAGEVVLRVPPMAVPGADDGVEAISANEAVRLFADRAIAATGAFELDATSTPIIGRICRAVDGIPLAIELAAARLGFLDLSEVADQLRDRFRLLAGGGRSAPERHRVLRGTLTWSYELLDPDAQRLFDSLAVFAGGFTFDAAEAVCGEEAGDLMRSLGRLVDHSLVETDRRPGLPMGYRQLETVRQLGLEHLSREDIDRLRNRHAEYYAALAERAEPELMGSGEALWAARLDREFANLRRAIEWSLGTGRYPVAIRILGALKAYFMSRDETVLEARVWVRRAMEGAATAPGQSVIRVLGVGGLLAWSWGDLDEAGDMHSAALILARKEGDPASIFNAVNDLGLVAVDRGDIDRARDLFTEGLAIARGGDDPARLAYALSNSALVGSPATQPDLARQALTVYREIGRASGIANMVMALGWWSLAAGELDDAGSHFDQSAALWRDLGNHAAEATALCGAADVAYQLARSDRSDEFIDRASSLSSEIEWSIGVAMTETRAGRNALSRGELETAEAVLRRAESSWRRAGLEPGLARVLGLRALAAAAGDDPEDGRPFLAASREIWERLGRLAGIAWTVRIGADLAVARGETDAALTLYLDAMRRFSAAAKDPIPLDGLLSPETGSKADVLTTLQSAAICAAPTRPRLAVELLTIVGRERGRIRCLIEDAMVDAILQRAHLVLGDQAYRTAVDRSSALTWQEALETVDRIASET